MKRQRFARLVGATAASVALSGLIVAAQGNGSRFSTALWGGEEVPSVSTGARGNLSLAINENDEEFEYELSYAGLNGTVLQAHIHFAQPGVNGGIVLWLCDTDANPSPHASTPPCPQGGTVSGTIPASEVRSTANQQGNAQQIAAGEFDEVVAAIRAGLAYANVHTNLSPGGEIRGQLKAGGGHR
jgi:hypothetical protein